MDPTEVEAIVNWLDLRTMHDVRSILGLCSYYQRFIRYFSEIVIPLHNLTLEKDLNSGGLIGKRCFIVSRKNCLPKLLDLKKASVVQCDA